MICNLYLKCTNKSRYYLPLTRNMLLVWFYTDEHKKKKKRNETLKFLMTMEEDLRDTCIPEQ